MMMMMRRRRRRRRRRRATMNLNDPMLGGYQKQDQDTLMRSNELQC
jgi:hypothetical protein